MNAREEELTARTLLADPERSPYCIALKTWTARTSSRFSFTVQGEVGRPMVE